MSDRKSAMKSARPGKSATKSATEPTGVALSIAPHVQPPAWPKTAAEQIVAGRQLLAISQTMRGDFKAWVSARCPYSYRAAAMWMKAAREAPALVEHADLIAGYGSARDLSEVAPLSDADSRQLQRWMSEHADIAASAPERLLGQLGPYWPMVRFGVIAQAVRHEIAQRRARLEALERLAGLLEALPADGLAITSERGSADVREAEIVKGLPEATRLIRDGQGHRVALRERVLEAWAREARRILLALAGHAPAEDAFLEEIEEALSSGDLLIAAPAFPEDEAHLERLMADIPKAADALLRLRLLEACRDEWSDERADAGLALTDDLPHELQRQADEHFAAMLDRNADVRAFWPDIPASPDTDDELPI